MCAKCEGSTPEVDAFIASEIERNPATEIDGIRVPRSHHTLIALLNATRKLEQQYWLDKDALEAAMTPEEKKAQDAAREALTRKEAEAFIAAFAKQTPLVVGRGSDGN